MEGRRRSGRCRVIAILIRRRWIGARSRLLPGCAVALAPQGRGKVDALAWGAGAVFPALRTAPLSRPCDRLLDGRQQQHAAARNRCDDAETDDDRDHWRWPGRNAGASKRKIMSLSNAGDRTFPSHGCLPQQHPFHKWQRRARGRVQQKPGVRRKEPRPGKGEAGALRGREKGGAHTRKCLIVIN